MRDLLQTSNINKHAGSVNRGNLHALTFRIFLAVLFYREMIVSDTFLLRFYIR